MQNIPFHDLTTSRLHLRRLRLDDLNHYYKRIASNENVTKYMLWKPHASMEESAASIRKVLSRYETGESLRWAIALRSSDELIGIIDLLPRDTENRVWSFAYMLGEDFWNQGFGTEALQAVINFAFQQCGVQRIVADHFAENPASGAVMKKIGMTYRETIAGKYVKNGISHDALVFEVSRLQWIDCCKSTFYNNS